MGYICEHCGHEGEVEEFFVCKNHIATGGYESCCACSEGRPCSESLK